MKLYTQLLSCFALLLGILLAQPLQAQRHTLPKWEARVGVGLFPTFLKDHVNTELQPISVELQYRPANRFSIGLLAGHSISEANFTHHTGNEQLFRNEFTMVALRGGIHSSPWERWEVYGGMLLGYTQSNVTYSEGDPIKQGQETMPVPQVRNGLLFSAYLGTSCKIHKKLYAFGEISYGLSLSTVGLAYRF
jgi:hypothetical protein